MERLKQSVRMRDETDKVLSPLWAFVPLLFFAAAASIAVLGFLIWRWQLPARITIAHAAFIAVIVLTGITGALLLLILIYKLIKRRNEHFKRHQLLEEDVVRALTSSAGKKRAKIEDKLASIERSTREAKLYEKEESAFLWAILSFFIPFVALYVAYFLMRDFYRHERREDFFLEDLKKTAEPIVALEMPRRFHSIPDRNVVLYLVLTILTVGIFGIYWLYTLIVDPNKHFSHQVAWEDELLSSLPKRTRA
jgi:nitrate reductase NapE component